MPGGRPSSLTDEVSAELCRLIGEDGLPDKDACAIAGVSTTRFYEWLKQGEAAKTGKFREFRDGIKKARSQFKATHIGVVRRAATEPSVEEKTVTRLLPSGETFAEHTVTTKPPTWQPSAWLLERKFPSEFSRRQLENVPTASAPEAAAPGETSADVPDYSNLSPAAFARDILGVGERYGTYPLTTKQLEMLATAQGNRRSAFPGAHASGKTFTVGAIYVLWWLWQYEESIVLITATKLTQTSRLWNEIRHFWDTSPKLRAGLGPKAELLDTVLRIDEYRYAERFTAAVNRTGGDAQATGAQGAHIPSGRVLIIMEEADGIHLAVYNALEGSMSSPNAKMVMLFNPLRRSGPAYNATRSEQWNTLHISGFDSPNLEGETVETMMERYSANPDDPWFDEEVHPGLTGRRYMLDLWLRCGQYGDPEWDGRGLGQYAAQGERSIFDSTLVDGLTVPQTFNRAAASNPMHKVRIGIDWAAGRGGDKLAIAVAQPSARGYHLVELQATNRVADTLDWTMDVIRPYLYYADVLGLDTGGGGEEMWNRIRDELNRISMENKPPLVRVYFGSAPLDTESYAEKRGEMYFGLRRLLREGRFHANLPLAVREQMLEQTYELDNQGRSRVLPKHLQKERGLSSPDELEAIAISVAPLRQWRSQSGQVAGL